MRGQLTNGELVTQEGGGGDVVHCLGGEHMALKNLISTEGQGKRVGGSVVHQVISHICRHMLQEGSLQAEAKSMPIAHQVEDQASWT